MRADIHDGPEHERLQSKAGYIDARPHIRQLEEILLQRTAGPYIGSDSVTRRCGSMSGLPEADAAERRASRRSVRTNGINNAGQIVGSYHDVEPVLGGPLTLR